MSEKKEAVELSSDEEFQTVLDISADLFEQGYFEVRPASSGIDIAVEDERLKEALQDTELKAPEYRRILARELDVLLTASIMAMSDKLLLEAPSLAGISEDEKEVVLERQARVRERFPIQRLQAERRAKAENVGDSLAAMSWQIVRGKAEPKARRVAPAAILRFSGAPAAVLSATPGYSGQLSGTTILMGIGDPRVTFFAMTLSDVNYLIRRLDKVREELEREEADSDE